MLITFRVSNFLSFNDEVEFSMASGLVKEPQFHVVKGKGRNDVSVLKASVIYGANASGKSNLIKAIDFAQSLVLKDIKSILAENKHFRLGKENKNQTSKFEFEIKIKEVCYAYGIVMSLKDKTIKEEWLFEVNKIGDKPIFERKVLENGKSDIEISHKFDKEGTNRFEVYKKDVKESQLFLAEINDKDIKDIKNIEPFIEVFNWFAHSLIIIYPSTKFAGLNFIGTDKELESTFCNYLSLFNTGINGIETIDLDFEKELKSIPEKIKIDILNDLKEENKGIIIEIQNQRYTIYKNEEGVPKIKSLMARHKVQGTEQDELFKISEESDGTQRLFDIIPLLSNLEKNNTIIIDELDRSLHPELTKKIVEIFLHNSKGIDNQLIVSTHESSMLDLNFLRRDEIWFIEKDTKTGASSLFSLEQFKPRKDKEIRKGYLQGRFGAIPFLSDISELGWLNN
jgi:uncharacterized protein